MEKSKGVIPAWKYGLSYLWEVHVESAPSMINPHMYVSLKNGRMQLCTKNAVYSYEDRYDNFRLLFKQIRLGDRAFERVLLLGLGLGSVPLLVELSGLSVEHMTFIEIDENVIYLAEKYGLNRLTTPYTTYCVDAQQFIKIHGEKYDLIISDIFIDDEIPTYFLSTAYLDSLDQLLAENGLIIINTLASTPEDRLKSDQYFNEIFQPKFDQGSKRHVWENYMLMNRNDL